MGSPGSLPPFGLVAGNGVLPALFARAARDRGHPVIAVAHRGETDPSLEGEVDALVWVRLGQLDAIVRALRSHRVEQAVLAGGIGRVRALTAARPDLGALRVVAKLRSLRDDALLRGVAAYLESHGVRVRAPTDLLPEVLAPEGHLAGPAPSAGQARDVALGLEVASLLGQADVGQGVVVRNGHVLALEAVEGTDECLRRGGRYGGPGACLVKVSKPGQDPRFDLPAVGPKTLEVMAEAGATLLAVEAGRTLLLEAETLLREAKAKKITVLGVRRPAR